MHVTSYNRCVRQAIRFRAKMKECARTVSRVFGVLGINKGVSHVSNALIYCMKSGCGAGFYHNLRPEQVKMVAGGRTHHNLLPDSRPVELGEVSEITKQMSLVEVECADLQLLSRSAA